MISLEDEINACGSIEYRKLKKSKSNRLFIIIIIIIIKQSRAEQLQRDNVSDFQERETGNEGGLGLEKYGV